MTFHIINVMILGLILMLVAMIVTDNIDEFKESIMMTLTTLCIYFVFCLACAIIYIIPLSIIYAK